MKIYYLLLLTTLFLGCKSIEKQKRQANSYFDKFPSELATRCDKQFPVLDSFTEKKYDTIKVSNNINYRYQIDSLVEIGDNIAAELLILKNRADSISDACANVVLSYMWDIERLNKSIKSLSHSYTPCDPDTIESLQIIYRRSTAREAVLYDSLSQYKYQLGVLTDQANKQIEDIERLDKEKGSWMWRAIGSWIGMALIIGGLVYMYIKK